MKWKYAFINDFDDNTLEKTYHELSPLRKERIDKKKQAIDKKRSLAAEILIKELLLSEFNIKEPIISSKKNGMPYIENSDIFISLAHSGEMAVCAASREPLGIDVEKIQKADLRLIKKICTEKEKEYIEQSEDLNIALLEIWTAKEAYFKKIGTGITDFKAIDTLSLNKNIFRIKDYIIQII